MGGEQYSTGTGVPAPEPVLYILLISSRFRLIRHDKRLYTIYSEPFIKILSSTEHFGNC